MPRPRVLLRRNNNFGWVVVRRNHSYWGRTFFGSVNVRDDGSWGIRNHDKPTTKTKIEDLHGDFGTRGQAVNALVTEIVKEERGS